MKIPVGWILELFGWFNGMVVQAKLKLILKFINKSVLFLSLKFLFN